MPSSDAPSYSFGQQLFMQGFEQGVGFYATQLEEVYRSAWADYRSAPELRTRTIKANAFLIILSQNCDIACRDDAQDPCIELAVFLPIKEKQRHLGNQFTRSVRKLQIWHSNQLYEAKVRETVRVPKRELYEAFAKEHAPSLESLTNEQRYTMAVWRANRYQRQALPDRFVEAFQPLFDATLPALEQAAQDPKDTSRSYIRAFYVYLDNATETGRCEFNMMALLRHDTPDDVQTALDDHVEELCNQLETQHRDFNLSDAIFLAGLAEKENTISVKTLDHYVKYNLDAVSLSHGDLDTGV